MRLQVQGGCYGWRALTRVRSSYWVSRALRMRHGGWVVGAGRRDLVDVEGPVIKDWGEVHRAGVEQMGGGLIGKAGSSPTALLSTG